MINDPQVRSEPDSHTNRPSTALIARGGIGGVLMGLANLVPGISGGTMLLAAGVYRPFIEAVSEVTSFKFRRQSLLLLTTIVLAAAGAIVLFAGPVRDLVVNDRWIMYSIFIGLTLGGVPLLRSMLSPMTSQAWVALIIGILLMAAMAWARPDASANASGNMLLLFIAGIAGAAAMVLPGVSGGYLLLMLGQYVPILTAIDDLKTGLLGTDGSPADLGLAVQSLRVIVPVGLGVLAGVVGVSHLVRWLLNHHEKPTLGFLLGLLLGAVIGLWPFQQGVQPTIGQVIKGQQVTAQSIDRIDAQDWPVQYFSPTAGQVGAGLACIVGGFLFTLGVARIGGGKSKPE